MHIIYKNKRLEEELTSTDLLIRRYDATIAKYVKRRIAVLAAVPDLAQPVLYVKPLLCHQLRGDRDEEFAVRVNAAYRIIFVPADPVVARKPDKGIDTARVTTICITELSNHYD